MEQVPYVPKVDLVRLAEEISVQEFHFVLLETYPWFETN